MAAGLVPAKPGGTGMALEDIRERMVFPRGDLLVSGDVWKGKAWTHISTSRGRQLQPPSPPNSSFPAPK